MKALANSADNPPDLEQSGLGLQCLLCLSFRVNMVKRAMKLCLDLQNIF